MMWSQARPCRKPRSGVRVRHDFHTEVTAFVADGVKQRTVMLTPNATSARQCRDYHLPSDSLPVRLIRVELSNCEFGDCGETQRPLVMQISMSFCAPLRDPYTSRPTLPHASRCIDLKSKQRYICRLLARVPG